MKKAILTAIILIAVLSGYAQTDSVEQIHKLRDQIYADVEFATLQGFNLPDYDFSSGAVNAMLRDAVTHRQSVKKSIAGATVLTIMGILIVSSNTDVTSPSYSTINSIGIAAMGGSVLFSISALSRNDKAKSKYRAAELRRMYNKQMNTFDSIN